MYLDFFKIKIFLSVYTAFCADQMVKGPFEFQLATLQNMKRFKGGEYLSIIDSTISGFVFSKLSLKTSVFRY